METVKSEILMKNNNHMILKNIFKEFGAWVLASIIGLGVASAFVLVYNYSGTHIANETGVTDYKWKPNQYQANMVEGNAWIRLDDYGFHNLSKPDKIDILLMGASHMEAAMIPTGSETGSLLNEKIENLQTYNIGMSGHELLICLDNLEAAIKTYHPQKYIIVQSGNLSFSDDMLTKALNHQMSNIPSYDSGVVFWLQKIPAIKDIYKQLEDKSKIDLKSGQFFIPKNSDVSVSANNESQSNKKEGFGWDSELLVKLLVEKSRLCEKYGIKLILAYTPSVGIDKNTNKFIRTDSAGLSEYMQIVCDNANIEFIDTFDDFKTSYDNEKSFPFGFNNTKPFVGHLNEKGHELLADRLANTIKMMEDNK